MRWSFIGGRKEHQRVGGRALGQTTPTGIVRGEGAGNGWAARVHVALGRNPALDRGSVVRRGPALGTLVLAVAFVAAGCGLNPGTGATPGSSERLQVVATTTVLADFVAQIGGDRVSVAALVPKGGEVHTFDPTPSDARRLAEADLVVANGLGLDDWLTGLAADAGATAPIVKLGENLPGAEYLEGDEHDGDEHDGEVDDHGASEAVNPHLWLDVANARRYAARIAEELERLDPSGAAAYRAAASAYDARLADLDAWIRTRIEAVPTDDRRVVSSHEAFPYYARAYGLEIVDVIVPSPGQEPSAAQIARLIEAIRASGVRAILAEAQFNPALAERIAAETGVPVVTNLYSDSVGDPPADTYEGLMRWNTERIVEALG
ncbi:MAG TPA: metal ABC transporter substrate-binding protein [Candidatus Binatia bacterium]|nr:metal ABC transporter substrate-binding protein [Candidatus Binatia bacterium]